MLAGLNLPRLDAPRAISSGNLTRRAFNPNQAPKNLTQAPNSAPDQFLIDAIQSTAMPLRLLTNTAPLFCRQMPACPNVFCSSINLEDTLVTVRQSQNPFFSDLTSSTAPRDCMLVTSAPARRASDNPRNYRASR